MHIVRADYRYYILLYEAEVVVDRTNATKQHGEVG